MYLSLAVAILLGAGGPTSSSVVQLQVASEDPPPGVPVLEAVVTTLEDAVINSAGLPAGSSLRAVTSGVTARRTLQHRYEQLLQGYPVFGSVLVAESDGALRNLLGLTLTSVLKTTQSTLLPAPNVSETRSILITAALFKVSSANLIPFATNVKAQTVYLNGFEGRHGLAIVASFVIHAPTTADPLAPNAVIDAYTGEVIASWNGLTAQTADSTISGAGGNSGLWGLQGYTGLLVTTSGATCKYDTSIFQIQHMNHAISSATFTPWSFPCSQATSTSYDAFNGGYAPMNDIAKSIDACYRTYKDDTSISPWSGMIKARGHYGVNYDNAYYDGTYINVGDGGTAFYPLTSLQTICHEISHGYTSRFSNLIYYGQPGGINEAFSDMAGEAAVFHETGTNDYIIGKVISKTSTPLRYMCSPSSDGQSINMAADYTAGMDPHYSSGVFNKAFCLLSKMTNWDTELAFVIFAHANRFYWSSTSTFNQAACGVQNSTNILLGAGYVPAVASAFGTVGVACAAA